MQAVLGLLLIALACVSSKPLATTEASVYWDPVQGKFSIATTGIDPAAVAYGFCDNMRLVNGWNTLQITTNPSFTDEIQMYAAGYMEGYLEADGIWSAYNNFLYRMLKNKPPPQALVDWSNEQIAWTRHMVMLNHVNDPYWNQVLLTMSQFDGLIKGYGDATASTPERKLGMIELFLWSASGDLYDLLPAVVPGEQVDWENLNRERFAEERMWRTSCSALIKGLFNGDGALVDVAVGHNTWTDFGSMVRTYKVFNFQLASAAGAKKVSFSSKPGLLYSKDDFYALDTNMVVLETTNGVMDNRLYSLISTQTLLTWQRIPIANRMARNGDEWTRVVAKYNSGTYCNQWMVVDYKQLLAPGKVAPGLLWISEQIPGMSQRADVTNVFMKRGGMWPSFNVPYFPDIYNVSGFPKYFAKFGNDYSYDKCPRAQIFARDGPKVKQFVDMRYIMQYNDFQNDPLSNGNPGNAIASRYDLRTGGSAFGAIDAKITSKADVAAMRVYAISGPTQQQPVFTWDDIRWQSIPHNGQPNTFNFVWQTMSFV